jgi:hypothetical protein
MKQLYILALIICYTLLSNSCKKDKNTNDIYDNIPGLPPATQIGANTFGCLVNGVPWVPQGFGGTTNLSIDYDPGFNYGIFNISAERIVSQSNFSSIGISIRDSLNYMKAPLQLNLSNNSLYGVFYSDENCFITYFDTTVIRKGTLILTTYDKTKGVIAGKFDAILFKVGCTDTIRITKGRFDFKF